MDNYVAEVSFAIKGDLQMSVREYNSKAAKFKAGLNAIELKHKDFLTQNNISMGVETVDNIDECTIKLRPLNQKLSEEIQGEIINLFNTTWSQ